MELASNKGIGKKTHRLARNSDDYASEFGVEFRRGDQVIWTTTANGKFSSSAFWEKIIR